MPLSYGTGCTGPIVWTCTHAIKELVSHTRRTVDRMDLTCLRLPYVWLSRHWTVLDRFIFSFIACSLVFFRLPIYYRTDAHNAPNNSLSHLILLKLEKCASNVNFLIWAIWQPSSPSSYSNPSLLLATWHNPKSISLIQFYLLQLLLELAMTKHQSHWLITATSPSLIVQSSRAHQHWWLGHLCLQVNVGNSHVDLQAEMSTLLCPYTGHLSLCSHGLLLVANFQHRGKKHDKSSLHPSTDSHLWLRSPPRHGWSVCPRTRWSIA